MICFRLQPQGSTRASQIENLADDLALTLRVESVLVRSLPQEGCVGIFVPRPKHEVHLVLWRDLLGFTNKATLPLSLGTDWLGNTVVDDLALLPHLLIAGSTGSGKSVLTRSLIATLIFRNAAKLVLSDTKGVEFTEFHKNPALLFGEIATTPLRTIEQMNTLCEITDTRLKMFGKVNVRNIAEWNNSTSSRGLENEVLDYIVLVIDELADIVFLPGEKGRAAKIGADKLDYLTRKSRAAGIHVIAGTQRPSVDTVKGVIKANFMARLSFKTASAIDSKVILDETGAEHLLECGDMLYRSPNLPGLQRLHSGYASKEDIHGSLEFARFAAEQRLLNQPDQ